MMSRRPISHYTRLFRDRGALTALRDVVIPSYESHISIASVGCSNGAEVYSILAVLWHIKNRMTIDGYDISSRELERAAAGIYENISPGEIARWVQHDGSVYNRRDHYLRTSHIPVATIGFEKMARERANFRRHDILSGPLPQAYDVIALLNMMYHYKDGSGIPSKVEMGCILKNVHASLSESGWLVCESRSRIYSAFMEDLSEFGFMKYDCEFVHEDAIIRPRIYRKITPSSDSSHAPQ